MPPRTGKKYTMKKAGELRRSQTITTFGSGAIVDFPHFSGIMSGIDNWNIALLPDDAKIREGNLERLLGKEFFIQASSPENDSDGNFGIPVFRFPHMYYCPECHMLDYYRKIGKPMTNNTKSSSDFHCSNCSTKGYPVKLIPSRFIVSCLNGHLDDFPYSWWVHRKHGSCGNPRLFLEYKGTTGGLDSIEISCECGARATMEGCMSKEALKGLKCGGKMPWIANGYIDPEECHAHLRAMQRSANNVYYPIHKSALTIPPWSSQIQKVLKKHSTILEDIFDEDDEMILMSRLKKHWAKYRDEYICPEDNFLKEAEIAFGKDDGEEEVTERSILENEYIAFCGGDVDHPYFKIANEDVPRSFARLIEQVKLVKRLREVQVLQGFRRIFPEHESNEDKRREEGIFEREFTPISKQSLNWLPAIELFGEGIFIKFNEDAISSWEEKNSFRYETMARRLKQPWIGKGMFSPQTCRYVMLHTFAHLLIRQLAFQCGYSTASLKEKIYSSFAESDEKMCGILIYTAATDSDGSLGGLVRQGTHERLENTIRSLLQEASWCSNDPICIESKAQGYQSLNYSACHACTLLPETSCESLNCLLDRASIVGSPENKDLAFFKDFI